MLSPHRTCAWLVAAVLALTATNVSAQNYPNDDQLFPPQDLRDMQPFASAESENCDGDQDAHRGFFFSYDGLVWSIKSPPTSSIGMAPSNSRLVFYGTDATYDYQVSEADTSPLRTQYKYGNRFEYGYMGRDHGIYGCYFGLQRLNQEYSLSDVDMVIDDPVYGLYNERRLQGLVTHNANMSLIAFPDQPNPPYLAGGSSVLRNIPVTFSWMDVQNKTDVWNTELLYVRRFRPCNRWCGNGRFELMMGARYFDLKDNFSVMAYGGSLADSRWNNEVINRIIGPEIGGRMWWTRGRWTFETDARFTAGFNRQNFHQQGELGENIPATRAVGSGFPYSLAPTGWEDHAYCDEFSPIVEGRLNLKYQLTRNINLRVGGTFIWIDNVARAANSIEYTMPSFEVNTGNNRENMWLAGVNVGIEVNR